MGQRNKKCIVPKYHHSDVGTEINALFWDVLIHVGCMLLLYAKSRKRMKHDGQICISVYSDHDSIIAHDRILSLWAVWCLSAFLGRVFFWMYSFRYIHIHIYILTFAFLDFKWLVYANWVTLLAWTLTTVLQLGWQLL